MGYSSTEMFANHRNAKCENFFSSCPCPYTEGLDAFSYASARKHDFLCLVLPVSLVAKTLKWACHFESVGLLGCPLWILQPFFPLTKSEGNHWAEFVRAGVLFPIGTKLFEEEVFGSFWIAVFKSHFYSYE